MPILLDTNVYLFAMKSDEGAVFFERHCLPIVFRTFLSSVVAEELYAGALNAGAVSLVERYVGALERAGRMVNDILLALSARRIGADLLTFNRGDFELIHRYKPFSLEVLR